MTLKNVLGQQIDVLHDGLVAAGEKNFFMFADRYAEGVYIVEIVAGGNVYQQKVVIK